MRRAHQRPDERQLGDLLEQLHDLVDDLNKGEPNAFGLLRLARSPMRIGYPTSSGLGGAVAVSVVDEEGVPMPAVSDRTGEAVVADDPIVLAREQMLQSLDDAKRNLEDAARAVRRSAPPAAGPGEPGCKVHARIFVEDAQGVRRPYFEPVEKDKEASERCWWCNDWLYNYGEDPIAGVLLARIQGKRITSRVIEEAYKAAGRKVPKPRPLVAGRR